MMNNIWKVGNNIDTDLIIAARYLNDASPENLSEHCLEDVIENFSKKAISGDIIIAGKNFGSGSSREHAPAAIKACGINCVIAESFARIFYRNAINIGLPIIECPEAASDIDAGDDISIDTEQGIIVNKTKNKSYHFEKFPEFIQKIVEAGSLMNYIKEKVS